MDVIGMQNKPIEGVWATSTYLSPLWSLSPGNKSFQTSLAAYNNTKPEWKEEEQQVLLLDMEARQQLWDQQLLQQKLANSKDNSLSCFRRSFSFYTLLVAGSYHPLYKTFWNDLVYPISNTTAMQFLPIALRIEGNHQNKAYIMRYKLQLKNKLHIEPKTHHL